MHPEDLRNSSEGQRPEGKEEWARLKYELDNLREQLSQRQQEIVALTQQQVRVLNEWISQEKELRERVKQLEALMQVTSSLVGAKSLEEMMEAAIRKLQECLGVECAWIHLLQENELHLCAQVGWTPEMIQEASVLKLGEGVTGLAAQSREPVIMDDVSQDPRHRIISTQLAGYRSLLGFPIKSRERLLGVIGLASRIPGKLGEMEKELAQSLANILASALEYRLVTIALEEKETRASAMNRLFSRLALSRDLGELGRLLADHFKTMAPIDRITVTLVRGDKLVFRSLYESIKGPWRDGEEMRPDYTVWERIASTKQPYYAPDLMKQTWVPTEEQLANCGIRSHFSLPLICRGEVFGVLCLCSRQPNAFGAKERDAILEVAVQTSPWFFSHYLSQECQSRLEGMERAFQEIGLALVKALESRYPERRGHSQRVASYAYKISRRMGFSEERCRKVHLAARVCDIGMLLLPDEVMLKRGPLSIIERSQLDLHPILSVDLLSPFDYFREILPFVRHHHEHYDGTGYPDRLKGEQIPLEARIIAVADYYDARTRPVGFMAAASLEKAFSELERGKGSLWDPEVVDAFRDVLTSNRDVDISEPI